MKGAVLRNRVLKTFSSNFLRFQIKTVDVMQLVSIKTVL